MKLRVLELGILQVKILTPIIIFIELYYLFSVFLCQGILKPQVLSHRMFDGSIFYFFKRLILHEHCVPFLCKHGLGHAPDSLQEI